MAKRKYLGLLDSRQGSGPQSWAPARWHDEGAKLFPLLSADFDDVGALIRDSIVPGSAPSEPVLGIDSRTLTVGSCFARELRDSLVEAGLEADSFWVPSGLNNTFALADFFGWIHDGQIRGFRYGRDGQEWTPSDERADYRKWIGQADCLVFTLGLAEVWEDSQTGFVFWRGVPEGIFDEQRHRFRLSTVQENVENINRLLTVIREMNPSAPIVLTLSPVPLKATFGDRSCVVADCVSKSTLRVALHEALSEPRAGVFYWPSFEIVRWVGAHIERATYGGDKGQSRDVARWVVHEIVQAFAESYFDSVSAARLASTH